MSQGKHVEIEASERHDRVVQPFLEADHKVSGTVPDKLEAVVVCALDGFEVGRRGGKERDVLEVGVVFLVKLAGESLGNRVTYRHVGHEMMHVMRALPPPDRQATAEVGDECTD
jgi:hypothetical protein